MTTVDIQTSDGLVAGKTYNFKVLAQNFIGDSSLSSAVTAIAASVPDAPTLNLASTTATQSSITLVWNAPADDGGSDITDYQVWWDRGTNSWEQAELTTSTATSYTKSGLSAGNEYKFYVKAVNVVGTSDASSTTTIMAATVPNAPSTPTTTLDGTQTNVIIDWNAPADNGGTDITSYAILIQKKDGTFAADSSCDGT